MRHTRHNSQAAVRGAGAPGSIGWLGGSIGLGLLAVLLSAAAARAFTINPARYLVALERGDSQIVKLTVTNNEPLPLNFVFGVTGATQDSSGRPRFGQRLDPAEEWVELGERLITVAPGHSQTVAYVITAPFNAEPGATHYLGLTVSPKTSAAGGVGVLAQAVSLVEVQVAGRAVERVETLAWRPRSFWPKDGSWRLALALANQGTVSVSLTGVARLKDRSGAVLAERPLNLGNRLLPQAARELEVVIPAPLGPLPGWYQAEADIRYGRTEQRLLARQTLWQLPGWLLVGAVSAFGGLAVIIFYLKIFSRSAGRRARPRRA